MAYTYDDFVAQAQKEGMLGQFSSYDLDLAKTYPEFGLSILSLKKDYKNATTDEGRLLANEAANELRKSYGNYTAGSSGSGYYSTGKLPGQIDSTLDQMGSFGSFEYGKEAPTYTNPYAQQPGGIVEKEMPIHVSNVMVVCSACAKPTKVGYKYIESEGKTKKVRFCKECNEVME